jgi:hypothetical protein
MTTGLPCWRWKNLKALPATSTDCVLPRALLAKLRRRDHRADRGRGDELRAEARALGLDPDQLAEVLLAQRVPAMGGPGFAGKVNVVRIVRVGGVGAGRGVRIAALPFVDPRVPAALDVSVVPTTVLPLIVGRSPGPPRARVTDPISISANARPA